MKTLLLFTLVLLLLSCNNNTEKKETNKAEKQEQQDPKLGFGLAEITMEPSLKTRIHEYFQLTRDLDIENLMNYIYPKIFEQAPREKMIEEIKSSFQNEEMKAQIDSIHIDKVSPAFKVEDGEYVKVYYSMKMAFDFNGDLEEDKKISVQMAERFGQDKVTMDPQTGIVSVWQSDSMIAVKDKISKNWTFISAKEEMVDAIFSDAVLGKLDELE